MHVSRRYRLAYSRLLSVFVALLLALALSPGAAAKPKETALPPPPAPGATRYFEPNVGQFPSGIRFVADAGNYRVNFYDDAFELQAVVDNDSEQAADFSSCLERPVTCVDMATKIKAVSTRTKFDHAQAPPEALTQIPGISSYYRGTESFESVPRYAGINYPSLWPGIDLTFRFDGKSLLEFVLVVADGADPAQFGLKGLEGERIEINLDGSAQITGKAGIFKKSKPVVIPNDQSAPPGANFVLDHDILRIALDGPAPSGGYQIDPAITYSTYFTGHAVDGNVRTVRGSNGSIYSAGFFADGLGSFGAFVKKFAVDNDVPFDAYIDGPSGADIALGIALSPNELQVGVVGLTRSTANDFPVFPIDKPLYSGISGNEDAFVARINNDRDDLPNYGHRNFSTYFGGQEQACPDASAVEGLTCVQEGAQGVTFDPTENINGPLGPGSMIISGFTNANAGFPVGVQSAYQDNYNENFDRTRDGFFAKINPDWPGPPSQVANEVRWSSYLGSSGDEYIDILVQADSSGNYWVSGMTNGVMPFGSASGGSYDYFMTRFANHSGSNLTNGLQFGGNGFDDPTDLDVQGSYATLNSETNSSNLISSPGAAQSGHGGVNGTTKAYIAQVVEQGANSTTQNFGSYLGGVGGARGRGVGVTGPIGQAGQRFFVSGGTGSSAFPVVGQIAGRSCGSGGENPFLSVIDTTTSLSSHLVYSTCFGGAANDLSEDLFVSGAPGAEQVVVTGPTFSPDIPIDKGTPGADPPLLTPHAPAPSAETAGFVTLFDMSAPPPGNYIAFASNRQPGPPYDQAFDDSAIWKMGEGGEGLAPVTGLSPGYAGSNFLVNPYSGSDTQPAISPNGTRILYTSNRNSDGWWDLYVVGRDGPSYYNCRLTNDPWEERRPTWAPNGQFIAFSSNGPGNRDIDVASYQEADQGCPTTLLRQRVTDVASQVGPGAAADAPSISPDSGCIAYMAGNVLDIGGGIPITADLYLTAAGSGSCAYGQGPLRLTNNDAEFNSYPAWSSATPSFPNGRIAYGSLAMAAVETVPPSDARLWVMNPDSPSTPTGPLTSFTGDFTGASSPAWSPDGLSVLAFGSINPGGDPDIWKLDPTPAYVAHNILEEIFGPETTTIDWWPAYGPGPLGPAGS